MINDFFEYYSFVDSSDLDKHFSNEKLCEEHLEYVRWNGRLECPHCKSSKKIYSMKTGFKCSKCRKPFSVRKGTIFESSPISLQVWFAAIWLVESTEGNITSSQLHRDIGVTQKTAWHMLKRIHSVIKAEAASELNRKQSIHSIEEITQLILKTKKRPINISNGPKTTRLTLCKH
jgi:transposase-like protein